MTTALAERQDDALPPEEGERRILVHNVTWQQYVTVRDTLDDDQHPGLRMFYLEGTLEIMTPLPPHEMKKTTIGRLIEAYALEKDLELNGYGSTTFRKEARARGLEPDECYCFGELRDVPEIAIEVVITHGGLDKLEIYRGLGVREVWFYHRSRFTLHHLRDEGYAQVSRSVFLPDLDLELLAQFVDRDSQTQAVKAFLQALRERP